jgi:hypothetical protein
MHGTSLARVVLATVGVSVVVTLGCGGSPSGPSPSGPFSVLSISPNGGSSVAPTAATIAGTGFQSGATVTVDGIRVDATVLSATTISLVMPARAAGHVSYVTVSNGQAQARVPGGFLYVAPPVISELRPNIGSTGGGTLLIINGTGVGAAATVTVGGVVSTFEAEWGENDPIYLSTPAHAAGTVEVIVTDRYGQAANGVFTYVSPATFDFNGDWKGYAENLAAWKFAHLELSIRNNVVVSVSCGQRHDGTGAASLTLDRPPIVANGGFSFAGSGGDSITGDIVAPNSAFGSINMAGCVPTGEWRVERK